MRRSAVLSLPLQLVFPAWALFTKRLTNFLPSMFWMGCLMDKEKMSLWVNHVKIMHPGLKTDPTISRRVFVNNIPGPNVIQLFTSVIYEC